MPNFRLKTQDFIMASIKASARRSGLLTDQQFIELASQKDLKDVINRLKTKYPDLGNISEPNLKEVESTLLRIFDAEADEFIKASPDATKLITLIKHEVDEEESVNLLKWSLGLGDIPKLREQPKKLGKEEALNLLRAKGFENEAKEGTRLYEKYVVPGLLDSVFVKFRLLKIINTVKKMGRAAKGLEPYVKLKVDLFNVVTILRGVKNNIDPKAIEELLILGEGNIRKDRLKEAAKSGSTQKALAYFESIGLPKADSARDLEKAYEKMMAKNNDRTYYKGYVEIGAVIGYLELKLEEITKLIRIANTVERGIDAKRAIQEFI